MAALQSTVATSHHPPPAASFLHRLVAAGGVALVLLLVTLSASPQLHDHAHGEEGLVPDDNCAVVLFGSGVDLVTDSAAILLPPRAWCEQSASANADVLTVRPRYLLPPECGPPLS